MDLIFQMIYGGQPIYILKDAHRVWPKTAKCVAQSLFSGIDNVILGISDIKNHIL